VFDEPVVFSVGADPEPDNQRSLAPAQSPVIWLILTGQTSSLNGLKWSDG
jgi:hypothetical protein